jgi:1-deoxy-D-xylulose-5-phosphate reductoisomerase
MRIPIQYALTAPERQPTPVESFSLTGLSLTFEEPDRLTFPAIDLAYAAGAQGGSSPAVLNAADEVAVEAFLRRRLGFLGIAAVVARTMETVPWREVSDVEAVLEADAEARATAAGFISGAC